MSTMLLSLQAFSQVTVSLGSLTGAGATSVLLATSTSNNRYSRTISLYPASEILSEGGMAGSIWALAWDKHGTGEYITNDAYIKVFMKHVSNSQWSTTAAPDWDAEVIGATEVFTSSTYSIPTGAGWVPLPLTTPFAWNGTDNIAVFVEWNRSNTPTAYITWGRSTNTDANASQVGDMSLSALTLMVNSNRPLLQLTIAPSAPCTTATVDTVHANPSAICLGETSYLSATGYSIGQGTVYKWQSSPDNNVWTDMAGDTLPSASVTPTADTYYRLIVECGTMSDTSISKFVEVTRTLPGNYTINSALPTGNGNYQSFTDFFNSLECGGITGNVIVDVAQGSGPYNEQVFISAITGVSASSQITINGNDNLVFDTLNVSADRAVLKIVGGSYINFNDLTFEASPTGSYGFAAQLLGDSTEYITFNQCTFRSTQSSASSSHAGLVLGSSATSATIAGAAPHHITIDSCVMEGGYYGLVLNGPVSGATSLNNTVTNAEIRDFRQFGIYMRGQNNTLIENNNIHRENRNTITDFYGIYMSGENPGTHISKNRIHDAATQNQGQASAAYPFYLTSASGDSANPILISNNLVYNINSSGIKYGYYIQNSSSYIHLYHNTMHLGNPFSTSSGIIRGLYSRHAVTELEFKNNIIVIEDGGIGNQHAMHFSDPGATADVDNNTYGLLSPGGVNLGYWGGNDHLTIIDWRSATGFDTLSNEDDPILIDPANGNLTPASNSADGTGTDLMAIVPDDINGVLRGTTPDAGAIEYTPLPCLLPLIDSVTISTINPTSVVAWFSTDTDVDSVRVEWGPSGFIPGSGSVDYGITSFVIDHYQGFSLAPNTCYDVYLISNCGGTLSQLTRGPKTFCTPCGPEPIPFIETLNGMSWVPRVTGYGGEIDDCWIRNKAGATGSPYAWYVFDGATPRVNTGPNSGKSGTGKYLCTYTSGLASAIDSAMLITPELDLSSVPYPVLLYWYHMFGADIEFLAVDVFHNGIWDRDVHVIVGQQQTGKSDPWKEQVVNLQGYSGDTIKVRFRAIKDNGYDSFISLDEISVVDAATICHSPINLVADSTSDISAYISWHSFGGRNATIQWGLEGFTPVAGSGVSGVTSPYTITGLNPGTPYEVYVMDSCDGNWVGPVAFQTQCAGPLNGTYTVGGVPGPANFGTLHAACYKLVNCGVGGPVTFNITGTHSIPDSMVLGSIQGVSPVNRIVFDGGTPANTTVTQPNGTGAIFDFNGAKHVTLRNMTIETLGGPNSIGVRFMGDSDSNIVEHNVISLNQNTTNVSVRGITIAYSGAPGVSVDHLIIRNNEFVGGSYGLIATGGNASAEGHNLTIENNTFSNHYYSGIRVNFYDSLTVAGNTIHMTRARSPYHQGQLIHGYGIYSNNNNNVLISGNAILAKTYCIYTSAMNTNAPTGQSQFVNNVLIKGAGTGDAVHFTGNSRNYKFYHNSIYSNGIALWDASSTNYDVRNNIFVSSGLVINYNAAPGANVLDNNLYYRPDGGPLAKCPGIYADLTALQTAQPGHNANSVAGDPGFTGVNDLTPRSTAPNDAGDNTLGVTVDFFGNPRPISGSGGVDMGAIEFTPNTWDAAMKGIYWSGAIPDCGDSAVELKVVVFNMGTNTINSLSVLATVVGAVNTNLNTVYTGPLPAMMYDTITVGTFNIYSGGTVDVQAHLVLANDGNTANDTSEVITREYIIPTPQFVQPVDSSCIGTQAMAFGFPWAGADYNWFENETDSVAIHRGDTLLFITDTAQTTYWLSYDRGSKDTLETTFAGGSGGGGNMFDVYTRREVLVEGFTINPINAKSSGITEVYYRPGSYVGHAEHPWEWTLIETDTGNHTLGGYSFELTDPLLLSAGQSHAFYIHCVNNMVKYTPAAIDGVLLTSNSDLEVFVGTGMANWFDSYNNVREFNGQITYSKGLKCAPGIRVPVTFQIDTMPEAAFTSSYTGGYGTGDYTFNATSSTGHLIWDFGDGTTSNDTVVNHTYLNNGTYTVTLVAYNSCGADTLVGFVVVEGITLGESALAGSLKVFPNPSSGIFNLEFELPVQEEVHLQVINTLGQVVSDEYLGDINAYSGTVDLSDLPKGVYILKLRAGDAVVNRRLSLH